MVVVGIMKNKILYITHPEFDIQEINLQSILLNNITLELSDNAYHTSLGDLSPKDIISMLPLFDKLCFIENKFSKESKIYKETIILLTYAGHHIVVENFNASAPLTFIQDQSIFTRPATPVLWVFGCSHSHGIGLLPEQKRYGDIISSKLDMPLKLISMPGSSIRWSLRHLLNANIQPNDIVIWQITTPERVSLYDTSVHEVLLASTKDKNLLATLTDEQIFFDHLSLINYGVNFLRAKNIKFALTSIERISSLFYNYKQEYVKYKEYCYAPGFDVDLGTDNLHFGEISHKNLALSLLDHIRDRYEE